MLASRLGDTDSHIFFANHSTISVKFLSGSSRKQNETRMMHPAKRGPSLTTKWKDFKRQAQRRGIDLDLRQHQFKRLLAQRCCMYCNAPSNGIDRVENDLGYTVENCVPCCYMCNFMKGRLSLREFALHAGKIARNMGTARACEASS